MAKLTPISKLYSFRANININHIYEFLEDIRLIEEVMDVESTNIDSFRSMIEIYLEIACKPDTSQEGMQSEVTRIIKSYKLV